MQDFSINVGFDAQSMATVEKMAGFEALQMLHMYDAGRASLEALQRETVFYMESEFKNPTDALSDSLERQMFGPFEGHVATNMPYARRREWGFSGMTDSLGRFYPDDPGIAYFEHAIEVTTDEIAGYYTKAVEQTIADVGGTP